VKQADKTQALCHAMAEILLERRLAAELTLTRMAELSGLTRQMVAFVEKGTRVPSLDTLAKLSIALSSPPSELLQEAEKRCRFRW
jgi:transcriptional regulator with XRE-family HTH domain